MNQEKKQVWSSEDAIARGKARRASIDELSKLAGASVTATKPIPSKAPEPIEPIRGSRYTSPSKPTKPIDWEHWGFMRYGEVPLWQAVALSVNINPDGMKTLEKAGDAFEKRLSIAASNVKARRLPVVYFVENERVTPVILGQFVAWAVNEGITNMPPELVALATPAPVLPTPAQNTTTNAPVVTKQAGGDAPAPAVPNWKMRIQTEATELVLRLRESGSSPTKFSTCESMAKWCRDNNVKTDNKIFPSANYLRTHVLGGKHWDLPR